MKKMLALLLCTALLGGCNPSPKLQTTTPAASAAPTQTATAQPAEKPFVPVLRFAAMTDVHFYYSHIPQQFKSMLQELYAYAAQQPNYKNLDAITIAGDLTQDAIPSTIEAYKKGVKENVKPETRVIACMGNHEFMKDTTKYASTGEIVYYTQEEAVQLFKEATNQEPNTHTVINGFHFIAWSPVIQGENITYAPNTQWLEEQLQAAAEDDPEKPIFVIQHYPLANTTYGNGSAKMTSGTLSRAKKVFENYPQVILLTGHSHHSPAFPTAIYQDKFTTLTSGPFMWYLTIEQNGDLLNATDNNGNQCLIVEVSADNEVRIVVFDKKERGSFFDEPWIIKKPSDPSTFTYTNDQRKSISAAPAFPADAQINIGSITSSGAKITFKRASCKENPMINEVYYYKLEIYEGSKGVKVLFLHSHFYNKSSKNTLYSYNLNGLKPGTEYTLKLFATDAYYRESEPLTASFKTN